MADGPGCAGVGRPKTCGARREFRRGGGSGVSEKISSLPPNRAPVLVGFSTDASGMAAARSHCFATPCAGPPARAGAVCMSGAPAGMRAPHGVCVGVGMGRGVNSGFLLGYAKYRVRGPIWAYSPIWVRNRCTQSTRPEIYPVELESRLGRTARPPSDFVSSPSRRRIRYLPR